MPQRPPQIGPQGAQLVDAPEGSGFDGTKMARATRQRILEKQARQDEWLKAYVACGYKIGVACEQAGVAQQTYSNWKSTDDRFLQKLREVDSERLRVEPAEAKKRIKDVTAFAEWRMRFLRVKNDDGHNRIADAITNAKAGRITLVLAPPEGGKTTTLEDYIAFRHSIDPNLRITYVHQSDTFAKDVVGRVQQIFTDENSYKDLIRAYGPFKGDGEWSSHAYMLARRTSTQRGPNLKGRSIFSKAQGIRADLLLIDDIQDITTLSQTARIMKILRQTFFTRAVRTAPVVMVGNRVDIGDVWEAIMDDPGLAELVEVITIPALENGRSLFPQVRSEEEWAQTRRLVGDDVWFRNYMQRPRQAGDGTFRVTDLQASLTTEKTAGTLEGWHGRGVVTGCDPALGGGAAFVTCVWGDDFIAPIDVTWKTGLKRNEEIYGIIADHAARYSPTDLVFEIASLQRGMARDERMEEMSREFGFRIVEHETSGKKMDPTLGVGAMASSFIRREVVIPADPLKPEDPAPLVFHLWDQLGTWRPDIPTKLLTQDAVMAFWFCWRWWREHRRYGQEEEGAWQTRGMPAAGPRLPSSARWGGTLTR